MSSPVTDGEQWSDELEETDAYVSPQGLGYAQLDYEVLAGEQEEDSENENEAEDAGNEGASVQQPDVASVMLRAMEADYRACVESAARMGETPVSNGPVLAATATSTEASRVEHVGSELVGSELEANESIVSTSGQDQGGSDGDGDGEEGFATAAPEAEVPPPRPISPLGQDQAERVMRAMQGFSLTPPVPPAARFEADWRSADALANLGATSAAASAAASAERGVDEGRGGALGRDGPNTDRDQR